MRPAPSRLIRRPAATCCPPGNSARHPFHCAAGHQLLELGRKLLFLRVDFHVRVGDRKDLLVFRGRDLMVRDRLADRGLQFDGFTAQDTQHRRMDSVPD